MSTGEEKIVAWRQKK